jgi:hypothetical protein
MFSDIPQRPVQNVRIGWALNWFLLWTTKRGLQVSLLAAQITPS